MKNSIEWFSYFDITPDLVCIAGKDGYFKKVNKSVIKKLGYTQKELFAIPISDFIHPEDRPQTAERRAKLLNGKHLVDFENRYVTKKGETIWLHWTSIYLTEKEVVFAMAKDITRSKRAEIEIEKKYKKFEGLASHFKTSIEKDRKYFAYELQEQIAQLAAVIKMDLNAAGNALQHAEESVRERIEHAGAASDLLLKTIQRISFNISPKMLTEFGLFETLEWLCKEFSILNNIPCTFKTTISEALLTQEVKTDFFRICQEALTNVIRHAEAENVYIRIDMHEEEVQLTITDDGKGFDIENSKPGYGFTHMRELTTSLNGKFGMQSDVGKGTSINIRI